jgi:hypothetical protein
VPDGGLGGVVRAATGDCVGQHLQLFRRLWKGSMCAAYACGWGTFTMEPLMLPMKTMLPLALRSICCYSDVSVSSVLLLLFGICQPKG